MASYEESESYVDPIVMRDTWRAAMAVGLLAVGYLGSEGRKWWDAGTYRGEVAEIQATFDQRIEGLRKEYQEKNDEFLHEAEVRVESLLKANSERLQQLSSQFSNGDFSALTAEIRAEAVKQLTTELKAQAKVIQALETESLKLAISQTAADRLQGGYGRNFKLLRFRWHNSRPVESHVNEWLETEGKNCVVHQVYTEENGEVYLVVSPRND